MRTEAAIGHGKQIQPTLASTTQQDHPSSRNWVCIHHLFEAQVRQTPGKLAVVHQREALTYHDLNSRANQLAHYLKHQGVGSEVLVGICLERSIDMIVGILAVLKAGGAYVPLDPAYPRERLVSILNDAQVTVVLTTQVLQQWLFEEFSTEVNAPSSASLVNSVACLDKLQDTIAAQSHSNPVTDTTAHHLAYVIYTSGSTGTPKGVMIEHRSLVNYAQAAATQYQLCATDRMLQFCSIGFDAAIEEIFCSLIRGTTLVLRTEAMFSTIQTFLSQCEALGITVLSLPTAFWHCLTDELTKLTLPNALRLVIIGGERAMPERFAIWQQRAGQVQLFNTYGPTETTVVATVSDLSTLATTKQDELPIGYSLGGMVIHVLNESLQVVAAGEVGELYLGGVSVARGYINRPELTAERFVQLDFAPGDRFYRTGDRVRQRSDGQLEFVGRVDHQVKIRGFRVELFEIEAALLDHPTVQDAVVVARTEGSYQQLMAYVVLHSPEVTAVASDAASLERELREFLKPKLPHYMIPSALVVLDKLPLTPSGKVDRCQLPQPHYRVDTASHTAPRTRLEAQLVELWSKVLGMRAIGVSDNFFELGGNSLLTVTLLTQLTDALQMEVPVAQFYANPTVAGLAQWVESAQSGQVRSLHPLDLAAEVVLSPEVAGKGKTLHWVDEPRSILLTGATGFLGAFLLHELLQTQATIHCLVRCAHPQEGLTKLQQILEKYQISHADLRSRVVVIPGNLEQPQLGLSEQQLEELAGTIDRIYHSGATVDFIKPYSLLKAANVLGTEEILKLACRKRLIPVHHISTIGIFGAIGHFTGRKVIAEEVDINVSLPFLPVDDGYAQSKWVAEKLVHIARSRGVPVSIYRPGFIVGHRQTGAHNPKDYICRIMKGCIQMGSFPDLGTCKEQMISVDYASQVIVHLSGQSEQLGKTFHITPPVGQDLLLSDLFELLRYYGYAIEKRPYSQWKIELIHQVKQSPDNALYPLLPLLTEKVYQDEFTLVELYNDCPDYDCQNTIDGLRDTSIAFSSVKSQILSTYLPHLIRSGFINPPSLEFQLVLEATPPKALHRFNTIATSILFGRAKNC
jgi:amino acid adenylation domain-containing protein/thioester reductase-like protein